MKNSIFKKIKKIYRWVRYGTTKKRDFRFLKQRFTRGWDDGQTFSLDYSLGKLIAPRLRRFKEITIGVPVGENEKEWAEKLDKMIFAFEYAGSEERWSDLQGLDKHQEGLQLFTDNYWKLWW